MEYEYKHLSVEALADRIGQMDILKDEDKLRLFTFFSANLLHCMPHIECGTHEAHFRTLCLHQHLSWKDQFDPDLHMRMRIIGWDQEWLEKFNSAPGIICTYHSGSYRLINRLLAEAGIPFSLVNFKTGFDRFKSYPSQSFGLINAEESDALFKMIRAFKSGQNLLIYIDGNTGTGTKNTNKLVVDFMQGRLSVRKGVAALASVLKCPIYPVSCIRPALDEVHFKIHKVLFRHAAADREAFIRQSMQQLYDNLASLLKKDPAQWECWLYLHQFLVLPKADVPPTQLEIKELGDARLWGLFNIGDEYFALHKPSFSSFDITALAREIKRNVH